MTTHAFQNLKPCTTQNGHHFAVSQPEPGQFGYAITYCTWCGRFRHELDVTPPKKETS